MELNANYASYLLRLRRVQNNDRPVWVASVQSTATGEQRPFADLEALVEFLRAEFGQREETPPGRPVTN
jgi:hypothetical protein